MCLREQSDPCRRTQANGLQGLRKQTIIIPSLLSVRNHRTVLRKAVRALELHQCPLDPSSIHIIPVNRTPTLGFSGPAAVQLALLLILFCRNPWTSTCKDLLKGVLSPMQGQLETKDVPRDTVVVVMNLTGPSNTCRSHQEAPWIPMSEIFRPSQSI